MSILLDALKKSESQRQLGTTPTLETPADNQEADSQGQRSWIPVVMSVSAAAIILWTGLAQFRWADTMTIPSVATAPTIPQEPMRTAPVESPDEGPAQPATTPMMEYEAAPPPITEDIAASLPPEQANQPAEPQELSITPFSIAGQEQPARDSGDTRVNGQLETQATGATDTDNPLEPYRAEPISYWQIPQSVRDSMGELRVSVLVYADDPQDRFLLVNGQRLREKEELSEGLLLLEIKRDRAIFSYSNYRFELKK